MKLKDWLKTAEKQLSAAGINSARLDCLILLEDELQRERSYILGHQELALSDIQVKKLNKKVAQRATHLPLAQIRGFTDFYGRKFKINRYVLEPRPESETMLELLLNQAKRQKLNANSWKVVDVGTGCGAIGITAALELHNHNVDLTDIDANCLAVARHNCALHELRLKTIKRDLMRNSHKTYDIILANLPYVPDNWKIDEAAAMEPRIAIFGGKDGLELYRRLFEQLNHFGGQPKFVFTESLPPQHNEMANIAYQQGFKQDKSKGFIQVFSRILKHS